ASQRSKKKSLEELVSVATRVYHTRQKYPRTKQLGHWKRECPNRRTGREPRRPDRPQQQMAVERTEAVNSKE
ncbi:hypothetical protein G0U57_009595, partial [Chelydra serpentina]